MEWKTLSGRKIQNIRAWAREAAGEGKVLHIGTDSLQTGRYTQFVSVVVIVNPGKGGRVAYGRIVGPRIKSLRERLLKEVWFSLSLALDLELPGLSIHIDASPEEKNLSNKYLQELVGMVVGQGFAAVIKPDSWAASHAADWVVRHKGRIPKKVVA